MSGAPAFSVTTDAASCPVRGRRDPERAATAVQALTTAAQEDRNLLPAILDCVRAEVTLGEISDALRGVYGEYMEAGLE